MPTPPPPTKPLHRLLFPERQLCVRPHAKRLASPTSPRSVTAAVRSGASGAQLLPRLGIGAQEALHAHTPHLTRRGRAITARDGRKGTFSVLPKGAQL